MILVDIYAVCHHYLNDCSSLLVTTSFAALMAVIGVSDVDQRIPDFCDGSHSWGLESSEECRPSAVLS